MTLPVGQISLSQVNTELSIPATTTITMNQANVRALAGVPTGAISMSNLQGKSALFPFTATISTPVQNYNLRNAMVSAGYPGTGAFSASVTVNPGIYVWSDDTATAAFDTGALSGGSITLTNNGLMMGRGGNGSTQNFTSPTTNTTIVAGSVGGFCINLQHPATIVNNSSIGGGGGGGGNGGPNGNAAGGGGQGGGAGGNISLPTTPVLPTRSAGGAIGASGTNGGSTPNQGATGGGAGRVFAGVGGAGAVATKPAGVGAVPLGGNGGTGGGSGAAKIVAPPVGVVTITSGAGGAAGVTGATPGTSTAGTGAGGGGGGFGAAGGGGRQSPTVVGGSGGAAGSAIRLNGNSVTRPVVGNTYGAVA